jgi:hypothetical protein
VNRPPFDLGLWAVCTAAAFAIVGYGFGIDGPSALRLAALAAGGLGVGWGFYTNLRGAGCRVSRPRPDQAEDYGDERPLDGTTGR